MKRLIFFLPLVLSVVFFSCRKDPVVTDSAARISFSLDTVFFDTVFTTVGSVTQRFLVYNNNDKRIIISNIRLGKGASSFFRMNIDGRPGRVIRDVEIPPNDSIFVFVEATINPNNQNNPLVVSDSILFETNGNLQQVQLVAWGQDAYFHVAQGGGLKIFYADTNELNIIWDNKKPHVVYGHAYIDTVQTLTIEAGAKICFHKRSGLIVKGSLKVKGTRTEPVVFQGDKLGYDYRNDASQWDRIWLLFGSRDNEIDHAIIKNGNVGIQVDTVVNANPTLKISNTVIKNMAGAALYALGARIDAYNCVFSNCGLYLVLLEIGGDYIFRHCTMANSWNRSIRQTASLKLNNHYTDREKRIHVRPLHRADFENCIIYGELENEIHLDKKEGAPFNYKFHHCLLKINPAVNTSNEAFYKNIIRNPVRNNDSTIFKRDPEADYDLSSNSIAIDKGDPAIIAANPTLRNDIRGAVRSGTPDLGAYEK